MSYDKDTIERGITMNGEPMAYDEAKQKLGAELYQKIEYDENGRRLSRKPNKGLTLGSYKFKSKKQKR